MPRFRMYAIVCLDPDCDEQEVLVEEEHHMGDAVDCDRGHHAIVVPAMPVATGILVEKYDRQLNRTFRSNAEYKDYLRFGSPIERDGMVVGHREIVEMSGDEKRRHMDAVKESMVTTARKRGLTLEEAMKVRHERTREKRAKEIEAGQTPTVSEPRPFRLD